MSPWSCIAQTKAGFDALWIVIYQRWKHTQSWGLLYFKCDWSWFQVAEVVQEQDGQSCFPTVPVLGTVSQREQRAAARAPGHSSPQQGCDLQCCHPNRKPGHFHCHFHPRKLIFCHRTAGKGNARPTATAESYCSGSSRDLWHREKQSSPKCPRKAWGGKMEIHSSSWGSKEAPGHRHQMRWQCWRRSSK